MARLIDPKKKDETEFPFRYKTAAQTNLRETFERVRREQEEEKKRLAEKLRNVIDVKRGKR